MKLFQEHKKWLGTLAVGVCLVGAAVGMAQRESNGPRPAVIASNAQELSHVFRGVADAAMPSIVSITTRGKAVQLTNQFGRPFEEDSPFGDLFRDNPQFREFFKRQPRGQTPRQSGKGSGFIIDPSGIVLTNSHVVRNSDEVVVKLYDGREYEAEVIGMDSRSDVAVVRINAEEELQAVPLGDSDLMYTGDWVLAVGSPFGFDLSVTAGIISGKGRGPGINKSEDYLQTDAAINPGNSGGPLLNLNGEVIGINTAISTRSGGYDGIGFAIPANMAKWVADQLIANGEVKRAYLGVQIQPLDRKVAKRFGTQPGHGALVTDIIEDSPAQKAELQNGDVILKLAGQDVAGTRGLVVITEKLEVGKSYDLEIVRDGEPMTLSIMPEEMPHNFGGKSEDEPKSDEPADEERNYNDLGIETQTLTPKLAEKFGVEGAEGVVVTAGGRRQSGGPCSD